MLVCYKADLLLPKKGTQGGLMDFSLARYFLKWSWLSSTASSRILLFLSGTAYKYTTKPYIPLLSVNYYSDSHCVRIINEQVTSNVWSRRYTGTELMALTISKTPLKLLSSWNTCRISITRENTATLSSTFSASTIHLSDRERNKEFTYRIDNIKNEDDVFLQHKMCCTVYGDDAIGYVLVTHFSNHRVRLVVCLIILSRFGEFFSLSSFVQTLPTSSDGRTALSTQMYNY